MADDESPSRIALAGAVPITPDKAPGLFTDYDADRSRDTARANITYWLLALFTLLIVGSFLAMYLFLEKKPEFEQLKVMIELILGPLVALVSAATGFYFGAQSRNNGSSRTPPSSASSQGPN